MQDSAPISESKTRRKHTTASIRQSHIESWKQSGLSMSEYCRQKGLSLSNFSSWVQTYNKSQTIFKPICVISMPSKPEIQKNIVEINLAEQITIRFVNVSDYTLIVNIAKELVKCS